MQVLGSRDRERDNEFCDLWGTQGRLIAVSLYKRLSSSTKNIQRYYQLSSTSTISFFTIFSLRILIPPYFHIKRERERERRHRLERTYESNREVKCHKKRQDASRYEWNLRFLFSLFSWHGVWIFRFVFSLLTMIVIININAMLISTSLSLRIHWLGAFSFKTLRRSFELKSIYPNRSPSWFSSDRKRRALNLRISNGVLVAVARFSIRLRYL